MQVYAQKAEWTPSIFAWSSVRKVSVKVLELFKVIVDFIAFQNK